MINVFIYDDNKARRDSLHSLLDLTENMQFAGCAADCSNVIEEMKTANPDVVLMDIDMPEVDGITGVRTIKQHFTDIKVIMQTVFDDEEKIFTCLKLGANGYILKRASIQHIIESITEVYNGGAFMSPGVALKVTRFFAEEKTIHDYALTQKEKEVLQYLAQGHSYKMVADEMNISYFTVNNHVKKIYEKLQVHSLGEAVALAHRNKLV